MVGTIAVQNRKLRERGIDPGTFRNRSSGDPRREPQVRICGFLARTAGAARAQWDFLALRLHFVAGVWTQMSTDRSRSLTAGLEELE